MARPICFVVMPFSTKETGLGPGEPGPKQVDFDALWDRALRPAIEDCGYAPVRADQDAGALIIVEMIQRLAMSDLVVADISIGNANVYYEIGVRHAAQQYGCVLLSAQWARVLFDIDQMPRVVYTMNDGSIGETGATTIRQEVSAGIEGLKDGESPVYQAVPGFPDTAHDDVRITRFKQDMADLDDLLGRLRAVRRIVDGDARRAAAMRERDTLRTQDAISDGVSIEMMHLLCDCVGFEAMQEWIDEMPERLRSRPSIQEARLLAISKTGDPQRAIGALEQLIATAGDSSEREGLLGGRYKKLAEAERDPAIAATYRDRAIEHYERGMMLDLNDYYPSCNLPRLYRARDAPGDVDRARLAGGIAMKACERARELDPDDEWLRPTLLGAAFDAQDVRGAADLAAEIRRARPGDWKLGTTIADLRVSTQQATDAAVFEALATTFNELNALLPAADQLPPLDPTDQPAPATADPARTDEPATTGKAKAKKAKKGTKRDKHKKKRKK